VRSRIRGKASFELHRSVASKRYLPILSSLEYIYDLAAALSFEFWVLLAGPHLCVEQYLWWHYNYKVCNFLALFWGGFARVFMKCIQVEAIARFGMDVVNGCLKLPLLVWYSLMGGDVHQMVVLNTLIAALWLYIQKVSVHMILFRTAYLITSHEFHHQFKNILCKYVKNIDRYEW